MKYIHQDSSVWVSDDGFLCPITKESAIGLIFLTPNGEEAKVFPSLHNFMGQHTRQVISYDGAAFRAASGALLEVNHDVIIKIK